MLRTSLGQRKKELIRGLTVPLFCGAFAGFCQGIILRNMTDFSGQDQNHIQLHGILYAYHAKENVRIEPSFLQIVNHVCVFNFSLWLSTTILLKDFPILIPGNTSDTTSLQQQHSKQTVKHLQRKKKKNTHMRARICSHESGSQFLFCMIPTFYQYCVNTHVCVQSLRKVL